MLYLYITFWQKVNLKLTLKKHINKNDFFIIILELYVKYERFDNSLEDLWKLTYFL